MVLKLDLGPWLLSLCFSLLFHQGYHRLSGFQVLLSNIPLTFLKQLHLYSTACRNM